jgi:Bacterial membrane protein YfhO
MEQFIAGDAGGLHGRILTQTNLKMTESDPAVRVGSPELSNVSDAWLTPFRFAIILAALIAAFFPDVIFAGRSFVFRDYGIFTYPVAYFQRESFWHGEVPLWNPLNNCGIPFLAQWNMAVLYPLSLLYILPPLTWGLGLFSFVHLFLAGLGMYLLASNWTGNRLAAAVAGTAFAFNGLTLNCLMWTGNLAGLAWMPWVVLAVERAWRLGGKNIILAALAGTMQMLTGAAEIIVFTWLILCALSIGQSMKGRPFSWRIFTRLFLVVLLVSLLSAAQLLPFLDLLAHSERNSALGMGFWSLPLWGWANLFVPLFHCYRSPLGVYFQPGQDWTSSYYPGIGALALALLAVFLVRTTRTWLLAGFAVFGFVTALGDRGELYAVMLKIFPPLGFMRYPVKFAFLTIFAIPLLAAFGVARLGTAGPNQSRIAWRWTLSVMMLSASVIGGIIWYARIFPFPGEQWPLLLQNGLLRAVFLVLVLGLVLIYGRVQTFRLQVITGLSVLVFVWLDIATFAPRQNPTVESSVFQPGSLAQRMDPVPHIGDARAFMTRQSHDSFYRSMLPDAYQDYIGRRCALLGNCNLLDDIPTADGFYPLYVREQRSLFMQFFSAPTNAFPHGFADFLGISQMSDPEKILRWQFRPSHLPYYAIGSQPMFIALSNTPALLLEPDFNPRRIVYLPPESKAALNATNQAHGTILSASWTARRLDFEVEADAPALLVLSQTYYHPWHAYVNGKPARLLRANYAFQAVEVPRGRSSVKLVYEDKFFLCGLILSGTTLLGCLFVLRQKGNDGFAPPAKPASVV